MEPQGTSCPSEGELICLLSGEAVWQDLGLPRHLMAGCTDCWTWLERSAARLDPAALPSGEPLAMAVITAAMAQSETSNGRFQLMRPLHIADAKQAPRDPMAFCRLVLHEALPAGLQGLHGESHAPSLTELAEAGKTQVQTTAAQLERTARPLIVAEQRHDLEAIGLAYQAAITCWVFRFDLAESILETAYRQLEKGSETYIVKVIWHSAAAMRERLVGLRRGSSSAKHLQTALSHLAAALECLPAENTELQRAELFHDMAQVYLALNDPPAATQYLEGAWRHMTEHQGTGLYLASLVRFGQAQAALAIAKAQPLVSPRRRWAKRAEVFLAEVQALGHIEPAMWDVEARETASLLSRLPSSAEHVTH